MYLYIHVYTTYTLTNIHTHICKVIPCESSLIDFTFLFTYFFILLEGVQVGKWSVGK